MRIFSNIAEITLSASYLSFFLATIITIICFPYVLRETLMENHEFKIHEAYTLGEKELCKIIDVSQPYFTNNGAKVIITYITAFYYDDRKHKEVMSISYYRSELFGENMISLWIKTNDRDYPHVVCSSMNFMDDTAVVTIQDSILSNGYLETIYSVIFVFWFTSFLLFFISKIFYIF